MWICFWRLNVRNILHAVLEGETKTLGILDKLLMLVSLKSESVRRSFLQSHLCWHVFSSPSSDWQTSCTLWAQWLVQTLTVCILKQHVYKKFNWHSVHWVRQGYICNKDGTAMTGLVLRRLIYWLQSLTRFLNDSITGIGNFLSFGLIRILILYKETVRTSGVNHKKTMIIVQPTGNSNGFRTPTNKIGNFSSQHIYKMTLSEKKLVNGANVPLLWVHCHHTSLWN